jgi:hypothetical protein
MSKLEAEGFSRFCQETTADAYVFCILKRQDKTPLIRVMHPPIFCAGAHGG